MCTKNRKGVQTLFFDLRCTGDIRIRDHGSQLYRQFHLSKLGFLQSD